MKRKTNTYTNVTHLHTGKSNDLCGTQNAAFLSSPRVKTYAKQANRLQQNQSGSVFFYILLGVVLFSALAFVISRGMRGQTSTALSQRSIDLAVSEILSDTQEIEVAISRLRQKGVSENDICFENDLFSTNNNSAYSLAPGCSEDTNKLYHRSGGNLAYRATLNNWLESSNSGEQGYGEWMFTNVNGVEGIGTSTMSDSGSMELIAFIPHLKKAVCQEINNRLTLGSIIPDNANAFNPKPIDNGFGMTAGQINAAELLEKYSGCFKSSNSWDAYIFYHVLIER